MKAEARPPGIRDDADGATERSDEPDQYCLADVEMVPVGFLSEMVYVRGSGQTRLLDVWMADLVKRCQGIATIEEHVQALVDDLTLNPDRAGLMVDQLRELAGDGFLVSLGDLEQRLLQITGASELAKAAAAIPGGGVIGPPEVVDQRGPARITTYLPGQSPAHGVQVVDQLGPARITTVAMVTRDRVPTAGRGLASYIQCCKEHGRTVDFLVMDDSADEATRTAYRDMLDSLSGRHEVAIRHVGLEEKRRLARSLVEAGLQPEVVDFALFGAEVSGTHVGANTNGELLLTGGEAILSVDDDTVCRLARPTESDDDIELYSRQDPTQFWYFPDRASALSAGTPVGEDILALHESLLGYDLRGAIRAHGGPEHLVLEDVSARMLTTLQRGGGRVLATMMGLMGDSGMELSLYNMLQRGPSFERLMRSRGTYERLVASREVHRSVSRATISEGAHLMTTAIGLDNRELLPPFMPVQRNQDGIYGVTLRKVFPLGYVGFLPRMITHEPPNTRVCSLAENIAAGTRLRMADIFIQLIQGFELPGGAWASAERMRALGRYLGDLAALEVKDFEETVLLQLRWSAGNQARFVERLLEERDEEPSYWARDVLAYHEALLAAATSPQLSWPRDLLGDYPGEHSLAMMKRLMARFAELLVLWPDMVEVARGFNG